jgi:hypothetical protein
MCNMTVFKYQHIKKALLKNSRAEMSISSVEAAGSAENTYLCPIPQTNGNISQAVHL